MGILRGNQRGVSLISLVIGAGVSVTVMTGFASFLVQQNQNLNKLKAKVHVMDLSVTLAKILSDSDSCDCMFNMSAPGNPYNNGPAIKTSVNTQIRIGSGNPDIVFNEFRVVSKNPTTGACNYGSAIPVAKVGDTIPSLPQNIPVESILLKDLQLSASWDQNEDGTNDAYEYKGHFEIAFKRADDGTHLKPLTAPVSFFTTAGRVAKSCDPSTETKALFDEKLAKFQTEREAVDTQHTADMELIRQLIQPIVDGYRPVAAAAVERVNTAAGAAEGVTRSNATRITASMSTKATQQERWASNKPGTGGTNDDFEEIMRDFKARWGFP